MANRIVLNNISYHGKGAIQEIVSEVKSNGYQHLFIATDPDLLQFGVTAKVTDILDNAGIAYTVYSKINGFSGLRSRCHRCHWRRLLYGHGKGDRHYHYQSGIRRCAFAGGCCSDEEPRRSHHCDSDNCRHCRRSNDQLCHHRCGKTAEVCLRGYQ